MHRNHLYYDDNPTGKLFNECFNDIRIKDIELMIPGHEYEIFLNEQYMGKAEIVAKREFQFKHLSDVLSYMQEGVPLKIYAARLQDRHAPDMETPLAHIILKWTERHQENQLTALHFWYQNALKYTWVPPVKQTA